MNPRPIISQPLGETRRADGALPHRKLAVIDIGSNSVRLVVYDVGARVPFQIFNEKVLCGLGRRLARSGELDPKARTAALQTIQRFAALAREMRVETMIAVATAAVRDATDGPDFITEVEKTSSIRANVLTGEEEARFSALGVLAGIPQADGVVGDLGGGSLELVELNVGHTGRAATLPLGPLRLMDQFGTDFRAIEAHIDDTLAAIDWLPRGTNRPLFVVGGAWRALARLQMQKENYPLRILHHFTIRRRAAEDLCRLIAHLGPRSLNRIGVVSKKRIATLPYAALTLGRLLEASGCSSVVISGFGLREGLVHDHLFGEGSTVDLLLEMSRELALSRGRFGEHGDEIMEWIDPLFPNEPKAHRRLRHAACLLSDIGWSGHPDYRDETVLREVLYSQLVGIEHADRALIAVALYISYGGLADSLADVTVARLLDEAALKRAEIIGRALRLAQRISGGTEGILSNCWLAHADNRLVLNVRAGNSHLVSETVEKRLKHLARALDVSYAIRSAATEPDS